jgi:hypothetical protein
MPSIRISATEILDAKMIRAFNASEQESAGATGKERVLTISKDDGQEIILRGELADAALAILRLHGF